MSKNRPTPTQVAPRSVRTITVELDVSCSPGVSDPRVRAAIAGAVRAALDRPSIDDDGLLRLHGSVRVTEVVR